MTVDWEVDSGKLKREFEFKDFVAAAAFIAAIVPLAEDLNHHPDLLLHSYRKVLVTLITHSEGRITDKDHTLARRIDALADRS